MKRRRNQGSDYEAWDAQAGQYKRVRHSGPEQYMSVTVRQPRPDWDLDRVPTLLDTVVTQTAKRIQDVLEDLRIFAAGAIYRATHRGDEDQYGLFHRINDIVNRYYVHIGRAFDVDDPYQITF